MFSHYATRKISPICKIATFYEDSSFLNPRSHLKGRKRPWKKIHDSHENHFFKNLYFFNTFVGAFGGFLTFNIKLSMLNKV